MLKETPLQPAFTAPCVFCSVEMGLHSSLIKPMWQKYFIWTFDKFVTMTYESSLSRVGHSLVYEVDVRPPHLIGRDPQDCDVVVVLWFPWQPVVWPCLQLKGGKGKKCKSQWWICYCSSRTLLPLTKQAELVPPFEPHRQTHILVRCHKHWSCLELLISTGKAKTRASQRMRGVEQWNYFCSLIGSDKSISGQGHWEEEIGERSESNGEAREATGWQARTRFMKTLVVISSFFSFCWETDREIGMQQQQQISDCGRLGLYQPGWQVETGSSPPGPSPSPPSNELAWPSCCSYWRAFGGASVLFLRLLDTKTQRKRKQQGWIVFYFVMFSTSVLGFL